MEGKLYKGQAVESDDSVLIQLPAAGGNGEPTPRASKLERTVSANGIGKEVIFSI